MTPPLPGEPGYDPQRMTIHRPRGGRTVNGPLRVRVTLTVETASAAEWSAEYGETYTAADVRRMVRDSIASAAETDGVIGPRGLIRSVTVRDGAY